MNLDSFKATVVATATKVALPEGGARVESVTASELVSRAGQRSAAEPGSAPLHTDDPPPSESATSFTTDITPSGIEVFYQSEPKRLYKVRRAHKATENVFGFQSHQWEYVPEVPSVTTVLGILNKPQLVWWGMQRGVEGVIDLFAKGVLATAFDWDIDQERIVVGNDFATEAMIVDALKEHKLTVNHRLEKASERGVNVHDALEAWAATGAMPRPSEFPESERPYVEGLLKFLTDVDPTPIRQEVMVGSVEHGFAGRFDLVMGVTGVREYTSRCYPKRADKRETLHLSTTPTILADLKTSRGTYATHHLQLAAYELAAVEGGYPATDAQAVIHVTDTGKYELVFSKATPDQFLAIRRAYAALEELNV